MPITPGWGLPEPEPSAPRWVSFSPRELCLLCVATQSNQTLAPFWSPSTALANTFSHPRLLRGSYSFAPIWLPHNPWKGHPPGSSGGCRGWSRLPWTESECWVGRLSSLLAVRTAPTSRAQMQEVHPRQPLHSCRGQAADPSSVPDPSEARSDGGRRWENAGMPAEPTPGMSTGGICSQDSRSPWAGVARLDWEVLTPSLRIPVQSSLILHLIRFYRVLGCPGATGRFYFICLFPDW